MFSSRMPPRLRERAMLRVFRRSPPEVPPAQGPGGEGPPAGLPGRHGPLVGNEAHRLQRGDPRGDLGGLADGQGHHPPADDQGHQDGRSVVQGVEPLGEEGQAHQRPQHHPCQQAQAPQPAALPVEPSTGSAGRWPPGCAAGHSSGSCPGWRCGRCSGSPGSPPPAPAPPAPAPWAEPPGGSCCRGTGNTRWRTLGRGESRPSAVWR